MTAHLGVVGVLGSAVEEGGGAVVLVAGRGDAAAQGGRLRVADVLVGFGEVGRLHAVRRIGRVEVGWMSQVVVVSASGDAGAAEARRVAHQGHDELRRQVSGAPAG